MIKNLLLKMLHYFCGNLSHVWNSFSNLTQSHLELSKFHMSALLHGGFIYKALQ